jgi:pimeloyl-ACP methyl ester carboxylesterase
MLCKLSTKNSQNDFLFVFFNGFGSDYKYWDELLPYFSNYGYVLLSENYFDNPEDYDEKYLKKIFEGKKLIGVGHSLGYHKLCDLNRKYDFFNLEKVISVEGFSRYLGNYEPMISIRKYYLDFMKNSYTYFPKITLYNFMLMCGAPMMSLPSQLNHELLMKDLELLYTEIESPKIPHLVLTSWDDWVIPFNIIEDNFRKLDDVKIIYTIGSGHLLGMQFPQYVSQEIIKFAAQ